jgi:hypothetical protein
MTMTTDEKLDALVAQLADLGIVQAWAPEVAPAAGTPPAHVAAGDLITSAWGNAVVDSILLPRGCTLQANTFPVPAGGTKTITWDAEYFDSDNYHAASSTNVVIPAGLRGIHAYTMILGADSGTFNPVSVNMTIDGRIFAGYMPANFNNIAVAGVVPVTDGAVANITIWNSDGAKARNFYAWWWVYRTAFN